VTTVVVVEDEILIRIAICEDLAAEGYEVLTADNADQAIEILESRNDITTIFTDIEMPGSMNGLKLAAAVRDRWPPVNIVITTGKVRPPDDQMPTNSRFVAKPYQKAKVFVEALQTFEG
jgi:two-component system, response regulator PdtaR